MVCLDVFSELRSLDVDFLVMCFKFISFGSESVKKFVGLCIKFVFINWLISLLFKLLILNVFLEVKCLSVCLCCVV